MSWSAFRTFTDPDAYHAAFRDMRTASVITGRGDFRADFVTIQLERLSLQDAKETLPRTAYCAVDPRLFGIGFATHPRQEIHVNSLELVPGAIVVFREASEGHNRFGSASRWGSVALPHEDIAAAGRTLIGHELVTPPHTHLIKPSPPVLSKLLSLHKAVGRLAEAAPEVLAGAEVARALEQTLIRVMIQCLSEGQGIEVGSSYWRHVAVMRRLENFLEANADRTLHLTDLCAAAAASDRTLRILCHEHLGMSPTRYLWLRRMHLARRALRMADLATTTVTEIATSYAFWELGHFAVAYRSLFGESPSATLRRPPEDPRPQKIFGSPWRLPESA
jgi:AraC-like DNA-binding protein